MSATQTIAAAGIAVRHPAAAPSEAASDSDERAGSAVPLDPGHAVREQPALTALRARGEGASTRLVGLLWSFPFQALITRQGSGIRRVRDLRDKRIALPGPGASLRRAQALRGAIAALESHGLHHRDVEWVSLADTIVPTDRAEGFSVASGCEDGEIELAALAERKVDAIYAHGHLGRSAAAASSSRLLIDISAQADPWVRAHSAVLYTMITNAATLQLWPQAVVSALGGKRHATDVSDRAVRPRVLDLADSSRKALVIYQQFLLRWGFVRNEVDLAAWIDRAPLAAAEARWPGEQASAQRP